MKIMAPEKVFLEVARKLLEFTLAGRLTFGDRSDAEGASLGSPAPSGVQGQHPGGGPGSMDCNSHLMESLIFWSINSKGMLC